MIADAAVREKMQAALATWHAPNAAVEIAEKILSLAAAQFVVAKPGTTLPRPGDEMKLQVVA